MTAVPEEVTRVREEAVCLHPASEVEAAIQRLAREIEGNLGDKAPVVISIMRGGLIFCGKLLPLLDFPLQLDYVHATRYNDSTAGSNVEWLVHPQMDLRGRHVLLVDDILDGGQTLLEVKNACLAMEPESVSVAVLVDKIHDRKYDPGFKADYCGMEVGDHYLFGYGMDYKTWLRNEPGIFAVKGS